MERVLTTSGVLPPRLRTKTATFQDSRAVRREALVVPEALAIAPTRKETSEEARRALRSGAPNDAPSTAASAKCTTNGRSEASLKCGTHMGRMFPESEFSLAI